MPPGPPSLSRRIVGLLVSAFAAAVGALIVGEYELVGFTPIIAGLLFGLAIAEVELTVGRDSGLGSALGTAALTVAGWLWAAWISSGQGVAPFPLGGWVGAVIGGAVAFAWVRWSARRGPSTRRDA